MNPSNHEWIKPTWTVGHLMEAVEQFAPPGFAMDGDVIGLQIGNAGKPVKRVMLALDAYPDVIHQAVTTGVDLLITHHALLYRPIQRLDTSTARGKALAVALAHDLAIYAAHTNLDVAEGGVNDVLADILNLQSVEVLDRVDHEPLRKLVVFVPVTHHEQVMEAVCAAGAGHIGRYSHCTFHTRGVGTFMPTEGTHPYIGAVGRLERTDEVRLETIVPASLLSRVIRAMMEAHPYEEVAYDVYPLGLTGKAYGLGRIGNLTEAVPLSNFAETVRDTLRLTHIRFGGSPSAMIRRVAVLGGAGGKWAARARAMGADVLVTSDVDHHSVAEAWHDGLAIIDATHAALERPVLTALAAHLKTVVEGHVDVQIYHGGEDPFTWL